VLIGELAEVLHSSPLLSVTGTVTIVPGASQREPLSAAIAAAASTPIASSTTPAIDRPCRFTLEAHRTELVIAPDSAQAISCYATPARAASPRCEGPA
jgi:hypothetical protein